MGLSFFNEFMCICSSLAFISNMLNIARYNHCKPVVLSRGDFAPAGHLPVSEGNFDWQGVTGTQEVKAWDMAKHPLLRRIASTTKNYLV